MVVVGIAAPPRRQTARHAHCGGGLGSQGCLGDAMAVVAADQEYLPDVIGDGRRAECLGDIAHVDGVDASVGGQYRLEEDQIAVEPSSAAGR